MVFSWMGKTILVTGGVESITTPHFVKGHVPWNKGKKGLQKAWNKGQYFSNISGLDDIKIRSLYWDQGLSLMKIAKIVGKTNSTVLHFMRRHEIPTRSRYESNMRRKLKIKRNCLICKKEMHLLESIIKKGMGKYCSIKCKSLSQNGKTPWNKGKPWSEDVKKKMRENHCDVSGPNHPLYGKGHSDESKLKMSKSGKAIWKDPEKRKNMLSSLMRRPTRPEVRFLEIVDKNMIPLRYTGDGTFWVSHLNPDFIPINNQQKVAVEIFGEYWHSPLRNMNTRLSAILSNREKEFHKHRWKMIVFWDTEVLSEKGEEIILGRLKNHGLL